MEISIKGNPKEIAALVVGLQGRPEIGQLSSHHDEGNRESMIRILEKRLERLKTGQPII